jgi:hypothetical protein
MKFKIIIESKNIIDILNKYFLLKQHKKAISIPNETKRANKNSFPQKKQYNVVVEFNIFEQKQPPFYHFNDKYYEKLKKYIYDIDCIRSCFFKQL